MAAIKKVFVLVVSWLLGIDAPNAKSIFSGGVEHWDIGFERVPRPVYWLVYLPLFAAIIYLIWWNYRREPDHLPQRRRRQLAWLRTGGAITLFIVFLGPYLHLQVDDNEARTMVVLVDNSKSMTIKDKRSEDLEYARAARAAGMRPYGEKKNNTVSDGDKTTIKDMSRYDLAQKLLFNKDLNLFGRLKDLGYTVDVEVFSSGSPQRLTADEGAPAPKDFQTDLAKPVGEQTNLGGALRAVVDDLSKRGSGQVLVLSDFSANTGEPPTQVAADAGLPIYTVAMGLPAAKDVQMVFMDSERLVFVEDLAPVSVRLRVNGYHDRDVTVELYEVPAATPKDMGTKVDAKTVHIGDDHEVDLTLDYKPKQKGDFILRARAVPLDGEATILNNEKEQPVTVTDQKIKVLLIANEPSWEWRYMKNGMKRDRRIDVHMILFGGDRDIVGGDFLAALPTREDLFKYDLLVIGNVPRERFSDKDLQNFVEFVTNENGAIWFIAGKNHMPEEYKNTPLAQLFPVDLGNVPPLTPSSERDQPFTEPFFASLTAEGRTSPLMRLNDDSVRNAQLWSEFPPMYWYMPDKSAKPAAQVLLENSAQRDERGRPATLLAYANIGRGRVLYQAFRDLWRMRYQPGPEHLDKFYGRAAQQLGLPHMLKGKARRLELSVDNDNKDVVLGASVKVTARVLDESFHPSTKEKQKLIVNYKSAGKQEPVELDPVPDQPGYYQGSFVASEDGQAVCTVEGLEDEQQLDLNIRRSDPEFDAPNLDEETFINIANASHAQHFEMDEVDKLFDGDRLQAAARKARKNSNNRLWDCPLFLLLFVGFFCSEWYLRKRSDLL
ncbi:MAG: hypothetical protein ACREJ2_10640 [Planctomycetota bacterium]